MVWHGHLHAADEDFRGQVTVQALDRSERTGQRNRIGAIDRRDGHVETTCFGKSQRHLAFRQTDGQHAPSAFCRGLQPRPVIAHQERVAKGECTADKRRAHLADTVPDNRSRFDTERRELGDEPDLYKKVGRLSVFGALNAGIRLGLEQFVENRPAGDLNEQRIDLGRCARERPIHGKNFASHAPPLRSYATEDEHRFGASRHGSAADRRCSGSDSVEMSRQFVLVGTGQHGPERVMRSAAPCG